MASREEKRNVERIDNQLRALRLSHQFCELQFKSFTALRTICKAFDPSLTKEEIQSVWYGRANVTPELCDKVQTVFEKLKNS